MKIINSLFSAAIMSGALLTSGVAIAETKADSQKHCVDFKDLIVQHNMTCGALEVPEDHANPMGKKISIAYVIVKSQDPNSKAYPAIGFSGGPGERSISKGALEYFQTSVITKKRDFILFDQRGGGYSSPLPDNAPDLLAMLGLDLTWEEELVHTRNIILKYKKIAEDQNIDLSKYNTPQNAADVGLLMKHLGYGKYNLNGGSYGSTIGRYVQDLFPEYVNSAIYSSPSLLNSDMLEMRIRTFDLGLGRILDFCKGDEACNAKHPNLRETYLSVLKKLETDPLVIQHQGKDYTINAQDGTYFVRRGLYAADAREFGPAIIEALNGGPVAPLIRVLEFDAIISNFVNNSFFLAFEQFESSDPNYTDAAIQKTYAKYPLLPVRLGYFDSLYQGGDYFHDGLMPVSDREFKQSDVPTLIFANQYDPVTPPENGKDYLKLLSAGTLLIADRGGHGGGDPKCTGDIGAAFMDNPKAKLDTSCMKLYKD